MTQQPIHSPDFVEIRTKEKTFQGLLMPGTNNVLVILKLSSGYNIGIERKNILDIKTLQLGGKKENIQKRLQINHKKKNIPTATFQRFLCCTPEERLAQKSTMKPEESARNSRQKIF
jgi:hypothetical protein